ncbi:hypothetical protein DFJ74DRAFT_741977 [Hyaloraphidium curvatum]|nr:hypothetical protein DFJ74DRAFT_741977 [Hyaloraphidium curvatum]
MPRVAAAAAAVSPAGAPPPRGRSTNNSAASLPAAAFDPPSSATSAHTSMSASPRTASPRRSQASAGTPRGGRRGRRDVPKQWACPEPGCGKAFERRFDLERHSWVHRTDRPFQCECGKTFIRKDYLRKHMVQVHPDWEIPAHLLEDDPQPPVAKRRKLTADNEEEISSSSGSTVQMTPPPSSDAGNSSPVLAKPKPSRAKAAKPPPKTPPRKPAAAPPKKSPPRPTLIRKPGKLAFGSGILPRTVPEAEPPNWPSDHSAESDDNATLHVEEPPKLADAPPAPYPEPSPDVMEASAVLATMSPMRSSNATATERGGSSSRRTPTRTPRKEKDRDRAAPPSPGSSRRSGGRLPFSPPFKAKPSQVKVFIDADSIPPSPSRGGGAQHGSPPRVIMYPPSMPVSPTYPSQGPAHHEIISALNGARRDPEPPSSDAEPDAREGDEPVEDEAVAVADILCSLGPQGSSPIRAPPGDEDGKSKEGEWSSLVAWSSPISPGR